MAKLKLRVNGRTRDVESDDPDVPLLYVLRNDLWLTGTHFGCGANQCGACNVHVDGKCVKACTVLAAQADGASVTTIW